MPVTAPTVVPDQITCADLGLGPQPEELGSVRNPEKSKMAFCATYCEVTGKGSLSPSLRKAWKTKASIFGEVHGQQSIGEN